MFGMKSHSRALRPTVCIAQECTSLSYLQSSFANLLISQDLVTRPLFLPSPPGILGLFGTGFSCDYRGCTCRWWIKSKTLLGLGTFWCSRTGLFIMISVVVFRIVVGRHFFDISNSLPIIKVPGILPVSNSGYQRWLGHVKLIPTNASEERMGFDITSVVGIYKVACNSSVSGIHGVKKLSSDRAA